MVFQIFTIHMLTLPEHVHLDPEGSIVVRYIYPEIQASLPAENGEGVILVVMGDHLSVC